MVIHHLRATILTLLLFLTLCTCARAQEATTDQNFIRIDQFGYLPEAAKVAVIAKADEGYNKDLGVRLNPGVMVRVVDNASGNVAFSSLPAAISITPSPTTRAR